MPSQATEKLKKVMRQTMAQGLMPKFHIYDRALGVMYMLGVWDSLEKFDRK